jgi:hypothetical protein
VAVLRASQAASRVIEMEREVAAVQERLSAADKRLSRLSDAQARAREAQNTILRVQGEFVDEQLAELSPLLEEPYQRLRPHIDWQKVRYKLRGDVRRMLSLLVGANLKPWFHVQQWPASRCRPLFLLAIHLSRRWCKLRIIGLSPNSIDSVEGRVSIA